MAAGKNKSLCQEPRISEFLSAILHYTLYTHTCSCFYWKNCVKGSTMDLLDSFRRHGEGISQTSTFISSKRKVSEREKERVFRLTD